MIRLLLFHLAVLLLDSPMTHRRTGQHLRGRTGRVRTRGNKRSSLSKSPTRRGAAVTHVKGLSGSLILASLKYICCMWQNTEVRARYLLHEMMDDLISAHIWWRKCAWPKVNWAGRGQWKILKRLVLSWDLKVGTDGFGRRLPEGGGSCLVLSGGKKRFALGKLQHWMFKQ